jgi:D-tyrosyl-tRNA(Tyr) deacylase
MRLLLQRVRFAELSIAGQVHARIGPGLLALAGIEVGDRPQELTRMAGKMARLRIFDDAEGKMNLSVTDTGGSCLVVSQFTLLADTAKGNRPGYSRAALPEEARPLFERFVQECRSLLPDRVHSGVFGADMQITLLNDGPVTLSLDSRKLDAT